MRRPQGELDLWSGGPCIAARGPWVVGAVRWGRDARGAGIHGWCLGLRDVSGEWALETGVEEDPRRTQCSLLGAIVASALGAREVNPVDLSRAMREYLRFCTRPGPKNLYCPSRNLALHRAEIGMAHPRRVHAQKKEPFV